MESDEPLFDLRGVRQQASGNWSVEISFQRKLTYIGTFKSQQEAALANYVAREILKTEEGLKLTSDEIEERAKVARALPWML